jgi:hypothetical protein
LIEWKRTGIEAAVFDLIFEIANLLTNVKHQSTGAGILEDRHTQTEIISVAVVLAGIGIAIVLPVLDTFDIDGSPLEQSMS